MNKKKETYIAALYGVTTDQQEELSHAISRTWFSIGHNAHIGNHATEDQQMIEFVRW